MKSIKFILKAITSRNFWKSGSPYIIILFWGILISSLTLVPFFYINEQNSFNDYLGGKLPPKDFLYSRKIIMEFGPWLVVIFTSFIILGINTLTYFIIYSISDKGNDNKRIKQFYVITTVAFVFWILELMFLTGYFYSVYRDFSDIIEGALYAKYKTGVESKDSQLLELLTQKFKIFVKDTEIMTLIMFSTFVIIDFCQLSAKSLQKRNPISLLEKKITNQQIWLIDIPVLCGILLIKLFSKNIDITNFYREETVYIFSVGAVAMHIIYSQIVFLVLNTSYYFNLYRINKTKYTLLV